MNESVSIIRYCGVLAVACVCLLIPFLSACGESEMNSSSRSIQMADKVFLMPLETEVHWWSVNSKESWLSFNLNIEIFQPHNPNTLEQKIKNIPVRIGPLSTMDRGYYWTEKDSVLKLPVISCEVLNYSGQKFELCDHGFTGKGEVDPHVYIIKKEVSEADITVLECRERANLPNPMCHARTRFLDNLQINYGYNISYFEKAIEIDQKLREFVLNFYQQP